MLQVPTELPLDAGMDEEEDAARTVLEVARLQARAREAQGPRAADPHPQPRRRDRRGGDRAALRPDLHQHRPRAAATSSRSGPTTRYVLAKRPCRVIVEGGVVPRPEDVSEALPSPEPRSPSSATARNRRQLIFGELICDSVTMPSPQMIIGTSSGSASLAQDAGLLGAIRTSSIVWSHVPDPSACPPHQLGPRGHHLARAPGPRPGDRRRSACSRTKPSQGPRPRARALGAALGEPLETALGQRLEQILLGGEVAVDGADADPGVAGDLVDLGVEAVRGELALRAAARTLSRLRRASARCGRALCVCGGLLRVMTHICDRIDTQTES